MDSQRQDRVADVLDRRLAHRPGDPDDRASELAPPGARQALERGKRIAAPPGPSPLVADSGSVPRARARERTPARPRRPRRRPRAPRRRTRRRRRARRAAPKKRSPGRTSRESITARSGPPAPAGAATSAPAAAAIRSATARSLGRRELEHRAALTPPWPQLRSSSRATSRSSKGIFRPPASSWPCSWPLPAITTVSPGVALAERERDRGPAVGLDLDLVRLRVGRSRRGSPR